MTHGNELRVEGNAGGRGRPGQRGIKRENWDNCNSIINKIYLKYIYLYICEYIYRRNVTVLFIFYKKFLPRS